MDAKTLTSAWTAISHASPLVADSWQLGEYLVVRMSGSASYDLFGLDSYGALAMGGLEEMKAEGARRWAADIAKRFQAQQVQAHEEAEKDVSVEDHGSITLFRPRSEVARAWINDNVEAGARWFGDGLIVEPRFVPYLIEGMVEGGLTFG